MKRGLVYVVFLLGCQGSEPTVAVQQQAVEVPGIGRFVVYADRSVRIGNHTSITSGDVGVALATRPEFGPQVVVGNYVDAGETDLFAPSATIGEHGRLRTAATGDAYPFSNMPSLPLAQVATTGGGDVLVAAHESRGLTPGSYGALTVEGSVVLAGGTYSFQSIFVGACGKLTASGTATVRVRDRLSMADSTGNDLAHGCAGEISVDSTAGLSAGDLSIDVSSDDSQAGVAAYVGSGSRITALLSAPHGTIQLADHVRVNGALAASDVRTGDHVALQLEDGFAAARAGEQGTQRLTGYFGVQPDKSIAPLLGPVPADAPIYLSIGLPVRDSVGLQAFIDDVSRPGSPNYRQFLTTDAFNATYGATSEDYAALQAWAVSGGLTVRHVYPDHLLMSVLGTAEQVEMLFHVNLVYRQASDGVHPFVAVDREPSVDVAPRLLWVTGFDQYRVPRHKMSCPTPSGGEEVPPHNNTTGPGDTFSAADLRSAYLGTNTACAGYTGDGQTVGIVALGSMSVSDVSTYIAGQTTGITPGTVGGPDTDDQVSWSVHSEHDLLNSGPDDEIGLDIETVLAMAPKARVRVFEGELDLSLTSAGNVDDLFEAIANDSSITVASNSWVVQYTSNLDQSVSEMAARGVSFYTASGDYGNIGDPGDSTHAMNQTIVGGTDLQSPAGVVEQTWSFGCPGVVFENSGGPVPGEVPGDNDLTGGGHLDGSTGFGRQCGCFPQPYCCGDAVGRPGYQDLSIIHPDINYSDPLSGGNGASATYRNYPDVAGIADDVAEYWGGGWFGNGGTSAAAPMWAGFTAVLNEYSHRNGVGPLGFANPSLYAIGMTRGTATDVYKDSFKDINDGVFNQVPNTLGYPAIDGYDLATGWGAPRCGLIQQLGTINPTAPQTFNTLLIHLATGHSGVDDDDPVYVRLYDLDASRASYLVNHEVKAAHQIGWDSIGNVKDLEIPLPTPLSPADVGGVGIHMGGDSTWDITGVQVALGSVAPGGSDPTFACITDMSGRNGCDVEQPGCDTNTGKLVDGHFGITELDENHSDAHFDTLAFGDPFSRNFGGCPAWGGSVAVTADSPIDGLEFIVDTGDDDLDDDAIATVDLYDPNGSHLSEPTIYLHRPSVSFDDQSQWDVHVQLTAGTIDLRDIGSFRVHVITGSNSLFGEEWNLEGLIIYGIHSTSNWQHTCLYSANGDPLHHFDAGDSSATKDFPAGVGCHL